jgi:uncharacterized protein (TIGR02757 family)
MKIPFDEMKGFLDDKVDLYNRHTFIHNDPISVPHLFTQKQDIEIAGFLTAIIAWGNRVTIIKNATELVRRMDFAPYAFISQAGEGDLKVFKTFIHRTFNGNDCIYFLQSLQNIYQNRGGLESIFSDVKTGGKTIREALIYFRHIFLASQVNSHAGKHIADVEKNASAKRLNMFLRWMVRRDNRNVDFGLWQTVKPSVLFCPLDVHSGNVARKLGLLTRKSNDWKAVEELTHQLRMFDPDDPVKYDFALFGIGVNEQF